MSLKHAILGFLSFAPMTGYDLKKTFDTSVRHFWSADQSQIYRTLTQIVDEGWAQVETIPQDERPNRKVYHLTEPGRTELEQWLRTPLPPEEEHSALLMQIFFAGRLSDDEALALFEREAERTRQALAQLQAVAQQFPNAASRDQSYVLLTLDYGIEANKYQLDWLEKVIARLERGESVIAPKQQAPQRRKHATRRK